MTKSNFSKNLKMLRQASGMSQKDLAIKLFTTLKTISHWESGYSEPNLESLTKLKNIFNVSYEELLD